MPTTNAWGRINTLPGLGGTFGLLGGKWGNNGVGNAPNNVVTWNFYAFPENIFLDYGVNMSTSSQMTQVAYRAAFERAAQAWSDVANVRLQQIDDNTRADISIFWRPIDGNGNTLAQTWYNFSDNPNSISPMTRASIEFDTGDYARAASASRVNSSDFEAVAVHELGHALGLAHVDDRNQIMYPYLVSDKELKRGDIEGIQVLYGAAAGADTRADIGSDGGETIDHSSNALSVRIWGLGGFDFLRSGAGADELYGGVGNDTLESGAGDDALHDAFGNDRHLGGAGADVIKDYAGQNTLDGGTQNDVIAGGYGNDRAVGGAGNDALLSDWHASSFWFGNDTLDGGAGDDRMMGGQGSDVFIFRPNEGNDSIGRLSLGTNNAVTTLSGADFQIGIDHLDVRAFGFGSASEVLNALRGSGDNTIFEALGTRVTIRDVDASLFTIDEFFWA